MSEKTCPWCGAELDIHDQTLLGATCNVRLAAARIPATFIAAWRHAVRGSRT